MAETVPGGAERRESAIRRVAAAIAPVILVFSLAGCAGEEGSGKDNNKDAPSGLILPSHEEIQQRIDEGLQEIPDSSEKLKFLVTRGCRAFVAYATGQWPTQIGSSQVEGERPLINTIGVAADRYDSIQQEVSNPDFAPTFEQEAGPTCGFTSYTRDGNEVRLYDAPFQADTQPSAAVPKATTHFEPICRAVSGALMADSIMVEAHAKDIAEPIVKFALESDLPPVNEPALREC